MKMLTQCLQMSRPVDEAVSSLVRHSETEADTVADGAGAALLRPLDGDAVRDSAVDSALQRSIWWKEIVDPDKAMGGDCYVQRWQEQVMLPADGREAGEMPSFRMASDDGIGVVLLLCLCFSALIVARSQHYLLQGIKEFFSTRRRENLFNDTTDARMQGKYLFAVVLSLSLGILLFDYQQQHFAEEVCQLSPYWLIGANVVMIGGAYLLRTILYAFVNMVFFDREQYAGWMDSYHLLTVAASLLFLPISLLVAFYELDISKWQILFSISAMIVEIFLIFKTYRIFFEGALGFLHLILYLCALEFLPLLTLWKAMVWVTQELTKLV